MTYQKELMTRKYGLYGTQEVFFLIKRVLAHQEQYIPHQKMSKYLHDGVYAGPNTGFESDYR